MAKKPGDVVYPPRFRRGGMGEVPEVQIAAMPDLAGSLAWSNPAAVDLAGLPKVWLLNSANGGGKTTYIRWLNWRMLEQGRSAFLAALDPAIRSLTTWYAGVEQPPTRDSIHTARWLRDYLDFIASERSSALLDMGGGSTALLDAARSTPDLHTQLQNAGLGVVACYPLTPRIDDLGVLDDLERAGFQPKATLLLLNQGRSDPTIPREEAFEAVVGHSVFKRALARGAIAVWMPALESDVMAEVEAKRLHFDMARDGLVPEGATFSPIGGLRRSAVGRWLALMEQAHQPVASWLP